MLGAVIEGATHRRLPDYLSEKIWAPAGMEYDATWWVDGPDGLAWAGSGIGATLRDYGRFELLAVNGFRLNGRPIVADQWSEGACVPHTIGGKRVDYEPFTGSKRFDVVALCRQSQATTPLFLLADSQISDC